MGRPVPARTRSLDELARSSGSTSWRSRTRWSRTAAKLDLYDTHAFLAVHAVGQDGTGLELRSTEIDAFIGRGWLVTVREDDSFTLDAVLGGGAIARAVAAGVGVMVHALLDVIVDGYFTAVDRLDDYYDQVSDSIFSDTRSGPDQQREWYDTAAPSPASTGWWRPWRGAVDPGAPRPRRRGPEIRPYFQDLYDHVLVVSESADTLRDAVTSLVEANLSLRDYRQNLVMKKVSSWAAVIAVPTLVTGYYGMNVPFPAAASAWASWWRPASSACCRCRCTWCSGGMADMAPVLAPALGLRGRPGSICSAQRSAEAGSTTTRRSSPATTVTPWAAPARASRAPTQAPGPRRSTRRTRRPRPRPPRRPQPRGHARPAGRGVPGRGRGGRVAGEGGQRAVVVAGEGRGVAEHGRVGTGAGHQAASSAGRPVGAAGGWGRSRPPRRRPRSGAGSVATASRN